MRSFRLINRDGRPRSAIRSYSRLVVVAGLLFASACLAQDSDGDGVGDELDCSPNDASIAFPHRFYFDLDGDQVGDIENPADICSKIPFPGSVLWHGDPDDNNAQVFPVPVPRADRIFGLDFLDSNEVNESVIPYVDELGVEALSVNIHWLLFESAPGIYDGPESTKLDSVRDVAYFTGIKLNLTISVVSPYGLVIPTDLAADFYSGALRLSDPTFIDRYKAALTNVHQRLGAAQLVSLQIGHEIDRLIRAAPIPFLWNDFETFYVAVAAHAKSLWGTQLKVGVTSTAFGLNDPVTGPFMDALNARSDIISFTYEPRGSDYAIADPVSVASDLGAVVARYPGRELAMQSVAFPSAPVTGSSETRQSQFIAALFSFWDAHADVLSYVSLYRLFDRSVDQTIAELATGLHIVEPGDEATAEGYFRSVGLRNFSQDGGAKSAYHTLRTQLFARGWDAFVEPSSRPFYLGLTSFPHDQIPDQALDEAVLNELYAIIASDADMVAHHFDLGVPWNDAVLDDFSSPVPPYSANVLDVWTKHRSRQPVGHKVTVSVNPLGIPRDRLAAYWGYGEDAYLNDNLEIVGTGVFADFHDRLLPPPFDGMTFDAPAVKTAYLAYLKRVIDFFNPDYLVTGIEVNLLVDLDDSSALNAYIDLQRYVYSELKADPAYAAVPIVVSYVAEYFLQDELGVPMLIDNIQQPSLEAAHIAAFQALEPYTDIIGLSVYPTKTRFSANQIPAYLFDSLFERLGGLTDKSFAITETGFPSEPFMLDTLPINSTPEKQSRFFELLYSEAADFGRVKFVTQFTPRDITAYMDRLRERAAAEPPLENAGLVEFFKSFEFNGLYDADGFAKPAAAIFANIAALDFVGHTSGPSEIFVSSPDGQLAIQIAIDASNQLYWSAERNGVSVIEASPLGITVDGIDLGSNAIAISDTFPLETNESFATRGAHSIGTNHYMMSIVTVNRAGPGDESLDIELRVFDDGLAYRYLIPGTGTRTVSGESSGWRFPETSRFWFQTSTTNYESFYYEGQIAAVSDDVGFPVTVEMLDGGGFVTLSEADVVNYSGMSVRAEFGDQTLRAQFLEDPQWTVEGRESSPWRFTVIAPDLNTLVNTDMLARLSPPPDTVLFPEGLDSDWIKPGKALWSWWSNNVSGADYNIQQGFIDDAHAMGLDYVVIDIWWENGFPANGLDQFQRLGDLVSYGRSDGRSVDLWVWKNFFELIDPVARQSFFDAVRDAGAVGIKVDSILGQGSDLAVAATLRETILREAAERELMINFHGMSKPSGLSRTYPNLIAQEGLAGLEVNGLAWEQGLFLPASHNATLPFTRYILGPGDYTPVTFDDRKIGGTTFAHQLATAGVLSSSVTHYADDPAMLQQVPEVQDLLQEMPTEWEETQIIPGSEIGELVTMARRYGDAWWLFVLNGDESAGKNISVNLSFLSSGNHDAVTIADLTATSVTRGESTVTANSALNIDLLPGGGFVGRFSMIPTERPFRMGTSTVPPDINQGWDDVYSFIAANADLVVHSIQEGVPWPEALLSNDLSTYSQNLQSLINYYKFQTDTFVPGHDVYLMVNPLDVSYDKKALYWGENPRMAIPSPWDTLPMNHPDVKTAFVNYLTALVKLFDPKYVAINIEANIFLAKRPLEWEQFKEFNAYVYDTMKSTYPDKFFFSTIQYEHMLGLHVASRNLQEQLVDSYPTVLIDEVRALLAHSDAVSISSYPYMAVESPVVIGGAGVLSPGFYDPALDLAAEYSLPLAFEQTGWITESFLTPDGKLVVGNETLQTNFLRKIFDLSTRNDILFISNFVAIDYGEAFGPGFVEKTWSTAGLWREDRTAKPSFELWQQVFNRNFVTP